MFDMLGWQPAASTMLDLFKCMLAEWPSRGGAFMILIDDVMPRHAPAHTCQHQRMPCKPCTRAFPVMYRRQHAHTASYQPVTPARFNNTQQLLHLTFDTVPITTEQPQCNAASLLNSLTFIKKDTYLAAAKQTAIVQQG